LANSNGFPVGLHYNAAAMNDYDVIIIGAGAAGLMCAIEAGKRGRRAWLVDHAIKTAEKIRISGGGRCNFTNIHTKPDNFLSHNPHFCRSALSQYTPHDFIGLVDKHGMEHHEKKLGQLFCDDSAQQIIDMLLQECADANVTISMDTQIFAIEHLDFYTIKTSRGEKTAASLVIATGGLSIPKIGASRFGYDAAEKFGHSITSLHAALVPLTFENELLDRCKELTGLSVEASVSHGKTTFAEGLLFTHRGISGPSILQISSYWRHGDDIVVNLAPGIDTLKFLKDKKNTNPKQDVTTGLSDIIPKRLAQSICDNRNISGRLADCPDKKLSEVAADVNGWRVKPAGSEGYRTAEVTLGGVDTTEISSKTMESAKKKGLYFIGEVMDVTGHLGGFNFQWAWSSGYVAGQSV